jgi:ABC-type sugar transport system substrate-binding protein
MKRALIVTLGLLLALLITSCVPAPAAAPASQAPAPTSAPEPAQAAKKAPEDMTIGLLQINLSHPFHLGEVEGAKEAARRYGFNLKVVSGEDDVNKQIQAFENLINEKVDAIAVNFIDYKAFGPAMAKAKAAGIPVICLHSQPDGCAGFLGFD